MLYHLIYNLITRRHDADHTLSLDKISTHSAQSHWEQRTFVLLLTLLISCGLLAQYSAGGWRFCIAHAIKWSIACGVIWAVSRLSIHTLMRFSPLAYAISILLLCYVGIMGWVAKGAQRWIDFGIVHIEPSELCKIVLPLFLTRLITKSPTWSMSTILYALCAIIPVFILILKQPDLGTAMLVLALSVTTLIAGGLPLRWIIIPTSILCILSPLLWSSLHSYQQQRIINLFQPEADPLGTGYHIIQSIIAIGSGGYFGKGFLQNTQSQLYYLPENATDFVFSLWAEEHGFVGCLIVILFFLSLCLWLLKQSLAIKNRTAAIITQVVAVQFALSSLINIAMVLGLLPVVGVPLPFLSLGGSNALMNGVSLGIAYGCIRRAKIERIFL